MKPCHQKDAPSYFDYWAASDTRERCARHYAAKFGGITLNCTLKVASKVLNDGNIYYWVSYGMRHPKDYPL